MSYHCVQTFACVNTAKKRHELKQEHKAGCLLTSVQVPKLDLTVLVRTHDDWQRGMDNDGIDSTGVPILKHGNRLIGRGFDIVDDYRAVCEGYDDQGS